MVNAPYKDEVVHMLPQPTSGGTSIEVARRIIASFRSVHDVAAESFSTMRPRQQAEILRSLPRMNPKFAQFVKEFRATHKAAADRASSLLEQNPSTLSPGDLEVVFAEVRERIEVASDLKEVKLDVQTVQNLERSAKTRRIVIETHLLSQQSPLVQPFGQGDDETQAKSIFALMRSYSTLVELTAPAAAATTASECVLPVPAVMNGAVAGVVTGTGSPAVAAPAVAAPAAAASAGPSTSWWPFGGQGDARGSQDHAGTPPPPPNLNSEEEEVVKAQIASLEDEANRANNDKDFNAARDAFLQAYSLSQKPNLLVSAANMALKSGDAQTAKGEYEVVLQRQDLPVKVRAVANNKLEEANAQLQLQPQTEQQAPQAPEQPQTEPQAGQAPEQPQIEPQAAQMTPGAKVLRLLLAKLQEAVASCFDQSETPRDLSLKHHALLRLQWWDGTEAAGNQLGGGQGSLFDIAAKLEAALIREKSLRASERRLMQSPAPHGQRLATVYDDLKKLISSADGQLGRMSTFDPQVDSPLDPKPFELIFSNEMATLVEYVGPELSASITELKEAVEEAASGNVEVLRSHLLTKNNKEADRVLQVTIARLQPRQSHDTFQLTHASVLRPGNSLSR